MNKTLIFLPQCLAKYLTNVGSFVMKISQFVYILCNV